MVLKCEHPYNYGNYGPTQGYFRWFKDGVEIAGEVSTEYWVGKTDDQSGRYACQFNTAGGKSAMSGDYQVHFTGKF